MVNIYVIMTLELVQIILMGFILYLKVKKTIKEKNILDFAILWVLILTFGLIFYNAYVNVSFGLGLPDQHIYVGNIEMGILLSMLATAPYFWFLLNLLGWRKWYTVPFVGAFYTTLYGILRPTNLLLTIYIVGAFIPGSIALIITAIKRKHGVSFAIGISVIMFVFTESFISPNMIALYYSLQYVLICVLILGITGWWDRKVFYDRKYQQKISSTWISNRFQ